MSRRVLILCPNPVGERMGGMGVRYTEIARALAAGGLDVTLAAREIAGAPPDGVQCATWPADRPGPLRALLAGADAVLTPPAAPHVLRELRRCGVRLAIDLYDPVPLEVLERHRAARPALRAVHATTAGDQLADALRSGHFFVCASERQRDLWIGALLAHGLLGPDLYDRDPALRATLGVVPFGVPALPPPQPAPGADPIRARFGQVPRDEPVLLWNGGLWRWLDAPAAIRAVALVRRHGLPAHLVFMGASAEGGAGSALAEARAVAIDEGVRDAVVFNDRWVDYDDRAGWLLAADAAISTHADHLESRFAFRTRLLDCLWTGLPPVVTAGDELAARIAADDLGAVAPPGDAGALAEGIERVLGRGRESYAPALRAAARDYAWPRVVAPLRAFLAGDGEPGRPGGAPVLARPPPSPPGARRSASPAWRGSLATRPGAHAGREPRVGHAHRADLRRARPARRHAAVGARPAQRRRAARAGGRQRVRRRHRRARARALAGGGAPDDRGERRRRGGAQPRRGGGADGPRRAAQQ